MTSVFLLSPHQPQKFLKFIKKQLSQYGLDCEVLTTPLDALLKVKECFGIKYKRLPKLRTQNAGPFKLNPSDFSFIQNHKFRKLRKKEFELLQFFITNRNQIVNRNTILENVWGPNVNPFSNTVDVHIARLRKIINTKQKEYLKTIHCVGYILEI